MNITKLTTIITLLIALSVSSERVVELIKNVYPPLNKENSDPTREGWRRAWLQAIALAASIVTTILARPVIPTDVFPDLNAPTIAALGLLASGGSAFWNSILTYVLQLKDIKEAAAVQARTVAELTVTGRAV